MNRKARACIAQHRMLSQGDRLVVGLSGGADSVALLHFLRDFAGEWALELLAVHLNHNLRGAESDADEAFVRQLCAQWGIGLAVYSAPVTQLAREQGKGIEECAREERYRLFARHAGTDGKIATAHTLSDSAETLLLNLARGTGLRGLCGIPPVRDNIIRPLITCTRQEIEAYCRDNRLTYVTDSTNGTDLYNRNRLRHRALPVLREVNPQALSAIGGLMETLREDADYLDQQGREALARLERGGDRYNGRELLALPRPIAKRVLLLLLHRYGVAPDRRCLERLLELVAVSGEAQLSSRWLCRCREGELSFLPAERALAPRFAPVERKLGLEDAILPIFPGKNLHLFGLDYEHYKLIIKNDEKLLKKALDYDRMDKSVICRSRLPGDAIRLVGRGCTKSLKKLYNEAAFSPDRRASNIVLAAGEDLLWVEGFGAAEAFAVREDTRRVLIVEILEDTICTQT